MSLIIHCMYPAVGYYQTSLLPTAPPSLEISYIYSSIPLFDKKSYYKLLSNLRDFTCPFCSNIPVICQSNLFTPMKMAVPPIELPSGTSVLSPIYYA